MRSHRLFRFAVLLLVAAVVPGFLRAAPPVPAGTASASGLWTELAEKPVLAARGNVSADVARRGVVPAEYRTLKLDRAVLNALLATAPAEFNRRAALAAGAPEEILPPVTEIELPVPGTAEFERFSVEDSPIMESGLAARYPEIRTYILQGLDHPEHSGRLDVTPAGLHAMILSARGQTFVDPYFADGSDPTVAIAYRKEDLSPTGKPFNCLVGPASAPSREMLARAETSLARPTGATLRVYRLALAADAEYTAAAGGGSVDGSGTFISAGTVNGALSSMVTTINRVDAVYERDFAIRMVLVNNTDKLIYLDPNTDPYTNTDPGTLLGENQTNVDNVIGNANYDIGHVFTTGGGGVAYRGVVCQTYDPNTGTGKAGGVTGSPVPRGDPYDIDYVAHEMGHQFGANHPFNSTTGNCGGGNRVASTAYEPGSGTTIMAYAGICSVSGNVQDLAPNSDDYFHTKSYDEIDAYTTTGTGRNVVLPTIATGNTPPTIATPTAYTIPIKTPFALTASASDANGDPLSYCWEEFDLGAAVNATTIAALDNGASPIFRSYAPTANPTRTFPSLTYILNNANVPPLRDPITGVLVGETLPLVARSAGLKFRCTVRDNRAGGGGSNYALVTLTVASGAGPFAITAPNTAVTLAGGSTQTVTWNVANTSVTPVLCANVKITLSTDGGVTFPFVLAASVANNGSASVTIPNTANAGTKQGRIKVEAIGNIFFDVSDAPLTITTTNTAPTLTNLGSLTVRRGTPAAVTGNVATATAGSSALASVSVSGVPDGANVTPSLSGSAVQLTATADCRLTTNNTSRTYPLTVTVTDAAGSTVSGTVSLIVTPNRAPTLGTAAATYANLTVYRNNSATVPPPAVAADADGNLAAAPYSVVLPTVPAPTGVGVAIDQTSGVVTATATSAATLGATPVRVTVLDTCGASVVKTFTLTVAAPTAPAFTSGTPPTGATAGTPFTFTFAASGPPAPTFTLTAGTLPPGLLLNGTTGVLSGTPTTPGVYNGIQVTASNGATPSAVQSFSLTVVNSFNNYAAANGLTGPNAAPTADADGDGLSNELEYALNLPSNAASVAPAGVVRDYSGTKYLSLRFTRVPLATDISYLVEASPDLAAWTTVASSTAGAVLTGAGIVSDAGGTAPLTVEVRDTVAQDPAAPGQRRFMRVRVTRP